MDEFSRTTVTIHVERDITELEHELDAYLTKKEKQIR